jgi:GTPase SAR1 family protein
LIFIKSLIRAENQNVEEKELISNYTFSLHVDNPQSLLNISQRWISEVEKKMSQSSIVVVGNKKDLRNDRATLLSQLTMQISIFSNFNFSMNVNYRINPTS